MARPSGDRHSDRQRSFSPVSWYAPQAAKTVTARPVETGPRVGVTAAADVPWRYWLSGDPTVSAYRLHKRRAR